MQPSRARIAILIETSKTYGRGVLAGVSRFLRTHHNWSIFIDERSLDDPTPGWVRFRRCDGILLRSRDRRVLQSVRRLGVPVVYLGEFYDTNLPFVISSDESLVRLGLEDLFDRGFRNIGYVGLKGAPWSERRQVAVEEQCAARGIAVHVLDAAERDGRLPSWPAHRRLLLKWLASLPKPVGIIACYDVIGTRILDACNELKVAVPEEVAVIGIDDDRCLCELSDPPLSSVAHDLERIGYRSASLLQEMLEGATPPTETIEIQPLGVVSRQSSDIVAIDDPDIATALRYIRENACTGINTKDVLRNVPLTRVTLNRRFLKLLGRSAKQEIMRVQLRRVKQLLTETDYKLDKIAQLAGFRHAEYMSSMFKRRLGITPGQFRQKNSL